MKIFLKPVFVKIPRDNKTNKPIGFCFVLPDYNHVFKKTKGRIRIVKFLLERKKITKARGMMQNYSLLTSVLSAENIEMNGTPFVEITN